MVNTPSENDGQKNNSEKFEILAIGSKDDLIHILEIPTSHLTIMGKSEQEEIVKRAELINYCFRLIKKYGNQFKENYLKLLSCQFLYRKWKSVIKWYDDIIAFELEKEGVNINEIEELAQHDSLNEKELMSKNRTVEEWKRLFSNLLESKPTNIAILELIMTQADNGQEIQTLHSKLNRKHSESFGIVQALIAQTKMGIEYIENNNPTNKELDQLKEFKEQYKGFLNN